MIRASTSEIAYQSGFTNGVHSSVADVPCNKGGQGNGFGPHELLEAALATCMTMTVRMHAEKHHLTLDGVDCEVFLDRSTPDVVTFQYSIILRGQLSQEQIAQLREAASSCPVMKTLAGAVTFKPMD